VGVALLFILYTGASALASHAQGRLTITFLNVGRAGQASQGEAILLRTADGRTALIDGGIDPTSLGQELDSRLPHWQRTLDIVLLTTPRLDHITGLQDIISRYGIGEAIDAGVLHPGTTYAQWRRTLSVHNIHYIQVSQRAVIPLGAQVTLQVLWPTSQLHKGGSEERDNALILRLVAPGLQLLLLGAAAQSNYALQGLLDSVDPSYLRAGIVQVVGEVGQAFAPALGEVLQNARPSLLVITPAALSARQRKAGIGSSVISTHLSPLQAASWQIVQTAQAGTVEVASTGSNWELNSA
jgi:beta-lactamase superfamily II metal-dependent hydrolase